MDDSDQMAVARTTWTLTPDAFDSLLYSLDSDREQAGRIYERTRRKLLEFFEARGSHMPDEHADQTFDRVMRKMAEGEKVENLGHYCYGVARYVWIEASRRRSREPVELDENIKLPVLEPSNNGFDERRELLERRMDCFEACLDKLAAETRGFIVEYYREEEGIKIGQRKLLATRLNTTLNALRLRASRLRREIVACTDTCMESRSEVYLCSIIMIMVGY